MVEKKRTTASPLMAGFLCKCPSCGQGRLFERFLKVTPVCGVCGQDFTEADTGDGPAVFVIFIVGFIVTFAALVVEVKYMPPYWLHAVLWLPLMVGLSLGLLQPLKGFMLALQFHHGAQEARVADDDNDDRD